ncbi:hypothetical protein AZ78_0329 [Lysobacter capsici AZ78]|uniref:Uncharacterized protein n=1 Tax=Lysobacter capsici AZ78 TaxID=1444315 RepID=A0A125U0I8_9GAMM|nr:hypothetical protein AZ78_0329 [Lysobacter capsici AZ78]
MIFVEIAIGSMAICKSTTPRSKQRGVVVRDERIVDSGIDSCLDSRDV